MNGKGWLQGQSHLTSSIKTTLFSQKNYRIIYGTDTSSSYEMRVSTETPKAMHRTACRNQPTWHPFPPVSSPACIVYVCECTCTQTKMTICPPLSQTQHFTKHPDRTYRLPSSDCCSGRFLEADFLRHAYQQPIETNSNPTLTFLSTVWMTLGFTSHSAVDGSTSPRVVLTIIVLRTVTDAANEQRRKMCSGVNSLTL
jgi:hypothetical protein